ncbi:MAG TPA: pitrilysin family protein [Bacteroidia bacterium]|nr:pitrilysin family protein [Bacteroidia bacterium]
MNETILSPDRTHIPQLILPEKIVITHAEKFALDNGIAVYSVSAGTQDVLKIEFVFTDKSTSHNSLLITSANKLIREGTVKHSAQEISEQLDFYGAYLETESSPDFSSIVLYTLNKYANETLNILSEVIFEAEYPEEELEIYKANSIQHLRYNKEKVAYMARKKINEVLYGAQHPYGYNESEDDYNSLQRESLTGFYQRYYQAGNCTVFIAGKNSDKTIPTLNTIFGSKSWLRAKESNGSEKEFTSSPDKKHFIPKEGALQSAIRVGRRIPEKKHEDFLPLQILNTVLGGYFGSRLMSNIREDKGFTYGIGSQLGSMLHSGFFVISTEVRSEVTQQALDEIYKEMKRLCVEPVLDKELEMVRNYMLGSFMRSVDGAFHLSDRCKSVVLFDMDYGFYERYITAIISTSPEYMMELATKYFSEDSFFEVVAGKK